jgi:hypothetical protein
MIKNEAMASKISALMLDISARLDESARMVKETCDEEDFKIYRSAVAKIMMEILFEALNPIYAEYPSLKPPGFK